MVESTSSCGSISSPATESSQAPDPPRLAPLQESTDRIVPCDGGALLRELDRMRTLLAARAASKGGFSLRQDERLLVVARFAPGLTLEAWHALTQERPLLDRTVGAQIPEPEPVENTAFSGLSPHGPWFVLALDPAQHPQLLTLCQNGAHLFQAVCPLTGALLPDPFRKHLTGELERIANGGELSLILLELITPAWMKKACPHEENDMYPDGMAQSFPSTALDFPMNSLARLARTHTRVCDTPGRLAVDRFVLVLPGTGPFRARALVERLIGDFCESIAAEYGVATRKGTGKTESTVSGENSKASSETPPVRIRAGIACCDGEQKLSADALLGHASTALTLAQPGHTRTFRKTGTAEPERKTQVQACEKQFLFFGDPE